MYVSLGLNINIFAFLLAVFMFISIQDRKERGHTDYRLFLTMLGAMCLMILVFSLILAFDGADSRIARCLLIASSVILHPVNSFISMAYAIFAENSTFGSERRFRYWVVPYLLPTTIIFCLSIASISTGWFFFIDEANNYISGPFLYIPMMVPFWYLIAAVVIVLGRRKRLGPREFSRMVVFPLPIIIGGSLQVWFNQFFLIIPSYILSLFILYSSIQERRLSYDHLTGAFNRSRLDGFLRAMIDSSRSSGKSFAALLADVNSFKTINDSYGHTEGDRALIKVVKTMRENVRRNDFLARYAGDEFVVVFPNCGKEELDEIVLRIIAGFVALPVQGGGYKLSISIGSAVFDPAGDLDAEAYIVRLDGLMYESKQRFHGNKSR